MKPICSNVFSLILFLLLAASVHAQPSPTAFTYQGELVESGVAANGSYDLYFELWKQKPAQDPVLAGANELLAQAVNEGVFTVVLDYGEYLEPGLFWYVKVFVRPTGDKDYTELAPMQQVWNAPAAGFAQVAAEAFSLTGRISESNLPLNAIKNTHVDPVNSGIYVSKGQLYEVLEIVDTAPSAGIVDVEAACNDANDLPITGDCDVPLSHPLDLKSFTANNWTDDLTASSWTCVYHQTVALALQIKAKIICLDVP